MGCFFINGIMKAAEGDETGFSIVECLVVLVLTGIIATAALPNIRRLQQEWVLWGGMESLEATLQWGRMHAVTSNAPLIFSVSDSGQNYFWIDAQTKDPVQNSGRTLPAGLKITSTPRSPLRFYQHGNAAPAGTFVIAGEVGSWSVIVSPGGRVRVEKN